MRADNNTPCPTCQGRKVVEGFCQSSPEWLGTESDDGMVCTPDEKCPTCGGSGVAKKE